MKATLFSLIFSSVFLFSSFAVCDSNEEAEDESFVFSEALLYVPNRILDFLDIFRIRIRVGPGVSLGARVTEVASGYVGSYATVHGGLPGPRMRQTPKLPLGFESHNGASMSIVDVTIDGGLGPNYSPTEIGIGAQLGIIGFDIGFDPIEVADFAAGVATYDIRDDDL